MNSFKCFLLWLLLLGWTTGLPLHAKLDLKDGDSFVFLGDSITHRGPYSQYIETFYVTRYPDRRIQFMNSGVSGDKAADALARFEEDIAVFNPDYVSVMLGMNDGGYMDFSQDIFETYRQDMDEVISRIQAIGAEPIIISPTIFDQRQYTLQCQDPEFRFIRLQASDHYNGTMAMFGAWGRERAMALELDYVNFWGPLNDLTMDLRKAEPLFTFVDDAIHPGPVGHAVMAHAFLEEMEPDRKIVSAISARQQNGQWHITGRNAAIYDIEGSTETVSFTVKAKSLPWVLPEEAIPGYVMAKSGHKLSNESLSIAGLQPGSYVITIDGRKLPKTYSHFTLAKKVELQANPATPQYQQAEKVAKLIKERFENTLGPYRDLQAKMKGKRREYGNGAPEVVEFRKQIQPELDKLLQLAGEYTDKIYDTAQPTQKRYTVERVSGASN